MHTYIYFSTCIVFPTCIEWAPSEFHQYFNTIDNKIVKINPSTCLIKTLSGGT